MKNIFISDNTIRYASAKDGVKISFRLKLDIASRLDALGVSSIETAPIADPQADFLLVKSMASAVKNAVLTVPVDILNPGGIDLAWEALKGAAHPRLQVPLPCSTVQMEYFCHKKPAAMMDILRDTVAHCVSLCSDVEFVALDFTRSEPNVLSEAIRTAVSAGARTVTVSDLAGNILPDEFSAAVRKVTAMLPEGISLGVQCSDELNLSDCCCIAAVRCGASEIKTCVLGRTSAKLDSFARILNAKSETLGAASPISSTQLSYTCEGIREMVLSYGENPRCVCGNMENAVEEESDCQELIPETYRMESYLINSGNIISSTCHLRLLKGDEILESVCVGNGPVDASFQAVEKLVGERYELDDFKIRSVTEGREAMGETLIQLRHKGKLYSGKGLSTDIVGSSILAYLDAANKIAFEEEKS